MGPDFDNYRKIHDCPTNDGLYSLIVSEDNQRYIAVGRGYPDPASFVNVWDCDSPLSSTRMTIWDIKKISSMSSRNELLAVAGGIRHLCNYSPGVTILSLATMSCTENLVLKRNHDNFEIKTASFIDRNVIVMGIEDLKSY